MKIEQFLEMGDGQLMTHEEAQVLNNDLAAKSVDDIPKKSRSMVSDYLTTALNMDSVDPNLVPTLNSLLKALQETA